MPRCCTHSFEHGMFVRECPGERAEAAMLVIHGLGESGLCFEGLTAHPRFAGRRRLIPDLPGYGRSLWPDQPRGLEEAADDLAAWLQWRKERPVVVLGHSMGGVIALLLAERHPGLVSGLIDVDGNKSMGDCSFSGPASHLSEDQFLRLGFGQLQEKVFRGAAGDPALRGYYVSMRLCDPRTFYRQSRELVELSRTETLARRLAQLPKPVLFLAGVPGGAAPRTLELIAEAKVPCLKIGPSGHWPFIDQPDQFTGAIQNFLELHA